MIAIENARLFGELQQSNATLKEALEQQTTTAEVLRIIASSPADLSAVFSAICGSAATLCGASAAALFLVEGDMLRRVHRHGAGQSRLLPVERRPLADVAPRPSTLPQRLVAGGRTIHTPDVLAHPALTDADAFVQRSGIRARLGTPLLRDGRAIGALIVDRLQPGPFSPQQIRLLETFADQAVVAIENSRLFNELRDRDERRRQELDRASAIQQRLLPADVQGWPGALDVAVRFRPAVETSGDFYDVLRLSPSSEGALPPLQIAVGDVAGKGMSAALVTALARSALRSTAAVPTELATPANALRLAGRRLNQDVGGGHFVACALAVLEPPGLLHTGPRLRLSNAAQVPVLLVRRGAVTELEAPGDRLPLGARPDGDYKDVEADLRAGDVVVFSSDGLVEAPALAHAVPGDHFPKPEKAGELFGFERLQRSATHWSAHATSAELIAQGIWSDLTAWCGSESHHDDMTLLVLRVPG